MTFESKVSAAWALLERPSDKLLESYPLTETGHRSVRAALDARGRRHLLVPIQKPLADLPVDGEAVGFETRPLAFAGDSGLVLDVTCTDSSVHPEFDLLIEDVLNAVDSLDTAGAAAIEAIARWRRFLALKNGRRLRFDEQMGLMAELVVLDRALDSNSDAVDAWRGPFKEPHDFEFDRGCVEVKAVGGELRSIEVHGLHQLDADNGRPLTLLLVEILEDQAGADVRTFAREIQERHEVDLAKPLSAMGLDLDESDDGLSAFIAGGALAVPVTSEVPRLVPSVESTETDISGVRYHIRIASLLPHVSGDDLDGVLRKALVSA